MSSVADLSTRGTGKKLDVVIIGGGVCGLVCAIALARRGLYAHVYEAAPKFGEIGAGIGVGFNALRILRSIGVFDDVLKHAGEDPKDPKVIHTVPRFFSGMDGHEPVYDYPTDPEGGMFGIARSVFLDALVGHVDPQHTHFNKRFTSVAQLSPDGHSARPTVYFSDGTSVEADVVVLADGIRGAGREVVTGKDPKEDVVFSNAICYRGLVPIEDAKRAGAKIDFSERPACFMGMGRHLTMFPIRGGKVVNVVAFVIDHTTEVGAIRLPSDQPLVASVPKEQLLKEYEGWGSDVTAVLSCIQNPNKWYVNIVHPPLARYAKGQVALVGDAAHAMTPHMGAGAGQGIEDVYLLSQLLTHTETTKENISSVLDVYSTIRRPRAQSVWDASLRASDIYEGYGPHGSSNEGRIQDLTDMWSFVWHHDAEDEFNSAVKTLQEQGVFSLQ